MTLSIIGLTISLISFLGTVLLISDKRSFQNEIRSSFKKVVDVEKNVQPLLDKHNEEQKQEEIKTRKASWHSFNTWKFQKGLMNPDVKSTPVCGSCLNDSLELDIEYKTVESESYYTSWGDVVHLESKKDYPLSAEQKCTVCGHVVDKWEYED